MKRAIGYTVLYAGAWIGGHNATSYTSLAVGVGVIFSIEFGIFIFKTLWGNPA